MTENKIWTKTIDFLKAGAGISIFLFAIHCLGFFYMSGYLNFFNIDLSFYEFNLFNDFFSLIMAILLFLLPILEISIILILVYNFLKIPNIKNWIKENKKSTIIFWAMIIFLLVAFSIGNYYVYANYNITFINSLLYFLNLFIICIVAAVILYFGSVFINKFFNKDEIDLLFLSIIILGMFLIICPRVEKFGREVAESKDRFVIVDSEYVVLYNTSDYAIVAKFEEIKNENKFNIHADNLIKLNLNNHNISYKKFDSLFEFIK